MVDIGSRIKSLRIERHMTQEQLAKLLKVTKSVVSAYEVSSRCPSYEVLLRMSSVFGVSTDYLLGNTGKYALDVSRLSAANLALVANLVDALSDK